GRFPFNVPSLRDLSRLDFTAPVTFFVGENGSGKSTLLEAIALATELPVAGSAEHRDPTLSAQDELAGALRLSWTRRTRRGFFLRAEDFFGHAQRLAAMREGLQASLRQVHEEYVDRPPLERDRVAAPFTGQLAALQGRYGEGLDAGSHGENFIKFFSNRLVPQGLYLLDEPEAPLSPVRQLALLARMAQAVRDGSQFIVATHSPILMAYPGATLLSFDASPPREVPWDAVEHVSLTRDFLNAPARFLRELLEP
ncbi:MAG TPA: AAA family ATPase, partial [Deinococcales bacterium]|nr:AAA family ATPase [Deinococcales bacterium]